MALRRTVVTGPLSSFLLAALGCAGTQAPKEFTYLESTPVRISEVHFNPSAEQGLSEFIEVANVSRGSVDLSGWQVTGAGRVGLPAGTTLRPGEALVLCQDALAFRDAYGSSVKPVAALKGKLRNAGETVRVEDPQGRVADEAAYEATDPEVARAAGTGASLHRQLAARGGATWKAGAPTPGKLE